jgi:hypothetical protein
MDPDPDPGGPKTCGSGGSGSATLHETFDQYVMSTNLKGSDGALERILREPSLLVQKLAGSSVYRRQEQAVVEALV